MNTVKRYCNATWSWASAFVTAGLLAFLAYSTLIQQPPLSYTTEGLRTAYTAVRGSSVFLENPIYPPGSNMRVQIAARMVNTDGSGSYRLARIDTEGGFLPSVTDAKFSYVRPGYPVYSVFVPHYVKPGTYTYQAEASYRLNMFRVARFQLPDITITVE